LRKARSLLDKSQADVLVQSVPEPQSFRSQVAPSESSSCQRLCSPRAEKSRKTKASLSRRVTRGGWRLVWVGEVGFVFSICSLFLGKTNKGSFVVERKRERSSLFVSGRVFSLRPRRLLLALSKPAGQPFAGPGSFGRELTVPLRTGRVHTLASLKVWGKRAIPRGPR
jgi:hypothetical protein